MKLSFERVKITPKQAEEILSNQPPNRGIRNNKVQEYAEDMASRRWMTDNGETLKFNRKGELKDGFHRLNAVILAGKPISFWVSRGLKDDVYKTIDSGTSRTSKDVFKLEGITYAGWIPSIITKYLSLKENNIGRHRANARPTKTLLLNMYHQDSERWQDVAGKTSTFYEDMSKVLPTSVIGSLYAHFSDLDEAAANEFWTLLSTGDTTFQPILSLRKKLIADRISNGKKMTVKTKMAVIVKTWNCYRTGDEGKNIRYKDDEAFPEAI